MSVISNGAAEIFRIFKEEGHEIYLVGGAVRNHFWRVPIKDRDFAISCPPETLIEICKRRGLAYVLTGIEFGTLTILIGDESFEVTSFRKDVSTDGRRAVTEFGGTLTDDALRRDFTINALYLDANGQLIDPMFGYADLKARRLCFIGRAEDRIKEDYLRILRFFRFLSQYELIGDYQATKAVENLADGLKQISKERIGQEMRKLLSGPRFDESLSLALKLGVLEIIDIRIELELVQSLAAFERLHDIKPDWRQRFVGLTINGSGPPEWRFSKAEKNYIDQLTRALQESEPHRLGYYFGADIGVKAWQLRAFNAHLLLHDEDIDRIIFASHQSFPLTGKDLLAFMPAGPQIGEVLRIVEREWLHNNFALEPRELLAKAQHYLRG